MAGALEELSGLEALAAAYEGEFADDRLAYAYVRTIGVEMTGVLGSHSFSSRPPR